MHRLHGLATACPCEPSLHGQVSRQPMAPVARGTFHHVDFGFMLTRAPHPPETDAGHPEGSHTMRTAATRLMRLSTCLVISYLSIGVTRGAAPTAAPATAPATQPAVVPELETRTGAFVPEDWGPLPDWESRRLVELVVKRGGAPLRVATREELWKRGRKVEAEFPQEVPPTRGGGRG